METKHLNRAQVRAQERMQGEFNELLNQIANKFMMLLITSDEAPDSEEVSKKFEEYSNRWRLFCKNKNLIPKAYTVLDEIMIGMIKDLKTKIEIPSEEPQTEGIKDGV